MSNPLLGAYYGYFLKGKALIRLGEDRREEALSCLQKAYHILWSIGEKNYINQVKDELKRCGVQILQIVLDGGNVENFYVKKLSQKITQTYIQENYIKPGETLPENEEIVMSAEQVVLKNVIADSVIIEELNQIIEQTFVECNYSISSNDVEKLLEKAVNKIAPNADPEVRRSLAIQVVRLSMEHENLQILPEQKSLILTKLSEIGIQEFQALISSDKKYKELRKRYGWLIIGGHLSGRVIGLVIGGSVIAGVAIGTGLTSAYYRRIIDELTSDDELYRGKEPEPLNPNEPEQEDKNRSSRRSSNDEESFRQRTQPIPIENLSDLEKIRRGTPEKKSNVYRENMPSRFPSSGGGGSGGGSISSGEDSFQWFENILGDGQGDGFMEVDFGDFDLIPMAVIDSIAEELVAGAIGSIAERFGEAIFGGIAEEIFGGLFEF